MTPLTLALPSRYHGAELIAFGGMADVYGATDSMLDRRVAIKILSERFALDPDVRARFTREARIAARLSNEPNIVTIFDVASVQERPAIVMEYLPGGTIADRMRAGRVPPALALAWLAQAGRALDAAHAQGVVHRDVKPANLMLSGEGELRVTDFGIARIAGDSALTSVGTVLGTSGYMSPEQAVGGTATPASDRYALAVVAFELLTGRRPYVGESFASEAAAHATAPIPAATTLDGSLPGAIDVVFERGLAKAPEDRFRSCGELVASLTGVFSESAGATVRLLPDDGPAASVPATSGKVHRTFRMGRLLALGTLALLGILAAAILTRDGSRPAALVTVMRTATVAGKPQVRTVTVEGQPAAAAPPQVTSAAAPSSSQSSLSSPSSQSSQGGAALNDQGFRLLQRGDAAGALPLLEQAVAELQGTGSLAEAYASYNLALARYSTGSCDGVKDLLEHSKKIQGERHEIKDLRHEVDKSCKRH